MKVKIGSLCDRRAALTMDLLERLLEAKGQSRIICQILHESNTLPSWNIVKLCGISWNILWSSTFLCSQSCKLLLPLLPPTALDQSHGMEGAVNSKKEISETSYWLSKVREKQEMFKPLERHIAQELAVQQVFRSHLGTPSGKKTSASRGTVVFASPPALSVICLHALS